MATRLSSNKKHLILVRHGQSTYNLENRFTGWKDVDLTEKGINEANDAIKLLEDIPIDIAFTSNLKTDHVILLDFVILKIQVSFLVHFLFLTFGQWF